MPIALRSGPPGRERLDDDEDAARRAAAAGAAGACARRLTPVSVIRCVNVLGRAPARSGSSARSSVDPLLHLRRDARERQPVARVPAGRDRRHRRHRRARRRGRRRPTPSVESRRGRELRVEVGELADVRVEIAAARDVVVDGRARAAVGPRVRSRRRAPSRSTARAVARPPRSGRGSRRSGARSRAARRACPRR